MSLQPQIVKKNITAARKREVMVNIFESALLRCLGPNPAIQPMLANASQCQPMINYWIEAMDSRVPTRPDIIVLPKICDVYVRLPGGLDAKRDWMALRSDTILSAFRQYAHEHNTWLLYLTYRDRGPSQYSNCSIFIKRETKQHKVT